MIQLNGFTYTGIDATGKPFSASWMDGDLYYAMGATRTAQIVAADENTKALANYNIVLANAQLNVNNGHDMPAPPKPLEKLVSDTGAVSFAPFNPPLADLIPHPPVGAPGSMFALGAGPAGTVAIAADLKAANQYNMISAMFHKMFPDA